MLVGPKVGGHHWLPLVHSFNSTQAFIAHAQPVCTVRLAGHPTLSAPPQHKYSSITDRERKKIPFPVNRTSKCTAFYTSTCMGLTLRAMVSWQQEQGLAAAGGTGQGGEGQEVRAGADPNAPGPCSPPLPPSPRTSPTKPGPRRPNGQRRFAHG